MDRADFVLLRDLPGKEVVEDVVFRTDKHCPECVLRCDQVRVENSLEWPVFVEGHLNLKTEGVTFNFVLEGTGPICRFDVNGTIHGDAGRTHKHDLKTARCPAQNLPQAVARADLEGLDARKLWELICRHAKIVHTGQFKILQA